MIPVAASMVEVGLRSMVMSVGEEKEVEVEAMARGVVVVVAKEVTSLLFRNSISILSIATKVETVMNLEWCLAGVRISRTRKEMKDVERRINRMGED